MVKSSDFKGVFVDDPNQRTWTFDLDGESFTITQWEVAVVLSLREAGEREAQLAQSNIAGE